MVNIATSVDEIASRGNPQFVDVMFLVQVLKAALSLNWLGETKAKEAVGLSSRLAKVQLDGLAGVCFNACFQGVAVPQSRPFWLRPQISAFPSPLRSGKRMLLQ
jgi:hypothetical protein